MKKVQEDEFKVSEIKKTPEALLSNEIPSEIDVVHSPYTSKLRLESK